MLAGNTEVNYEGSLTAPILLVGESPGVDELEEGRPFFGRSGRLLKKTLREYGIPEDLCFFANSARCMINKDALTQKQINSILVSCRPSLETIIHHIKPKVIVTLGAIALQQLLNIKGVKKARGNFYRSDEFDSWVIPNWHPAYILRNANEEDNFRRVFAILKEFMDNGYKVKDTETLEYREVESIRPLLDGGLMRASDDSCYVTAIDTETQGLRWYSEDCIPISYSVAVSGVEGWNIVLHEEVAPGEGDFDIMIQRGGPKIARDWTVVGVKKTSNYDAKVTELRELLSRKDIQKYYMNQKFEMHWFERLGINVLDKEQFASNPIDVALLAHTFDAPRYVGANLGYLLESFCNVSASYKEEWTETELEDMLFQLREDRDKFNRRACFDAVATLKIALVQIQELDKDRETLNYYVNFAHKIETGILYEIERNGIAIDEEALPGLNEELNEQMYREVENFKRLCPVAVRAKHESQFSLTRRSILMDALYRYEDKDGEFVDLGFGLTPFELSPKTKLPKVNKEVIKLILDSKAPEAAKNLLMVYQKWGDLYTIKSRYIKQIEECISADGTIHPNYSLTRTASGRTGARQPSIQNFPKRSEVSYMIRRLLIARPGYKFIEADHSMSELRWAAFIANEPTMKKIFALGGDIHLYTGAKVGGHSINMGSKAEIKAQLLELELTSEEIAHLRQSAKAVNFGLIYLMSSYGLRNYAYQGFGVKITDKQAEEQRESFFDLYSKILSWHRESLNEMENTGSITTKFGRRIPIPNIYADDRFVQKEAERFGINALVQGPSSDYTLLGGDNTIRNDDYSREECKVVLFIHDAFVFEVKEELEDKYDRLIKEGLETVDTSKFGFALDVPFVAESKHGYNLWEMEEYPPKEA